MSLAGRGVHRVPHVRLSARMALNPFAAPSPRPSRDRSPLIDRDSRSVAVGYWFGVVLFHRLPRSVWRYRWELSPLVVALAPVSVLSSWWGLLLGVPLGVLAARLWLNSAAREDHAAYRALCRFRDSWPDHAEALGLSVTDSRDRVLTPRIVESENLGGGSFRWLLDLPRGLTVEDLDRRREELAVAYRASSLMAERDPRRAHMASLTVTGQNDPLYLDPLSADPILCMPAGQPSDTRIVLGYTSTREPVTLPLFEKGYLVAGAPGAGKSGGLANILACAALMRDVELWLIDAKNGAEQARWSPCAKRFATTPAEAREMLSDLVVIMDERYEVLRASGASKITPGADTPLIFIIVDEVSRITGSGGAEAKEANRLLRELVQVGRAAGLILAICSQKIDATTLDTNIRDNMAFRLAYRCGTEAQAITVLGDEAVRNLGADAHKLGDTAGVGYLVGEEGGKAVRLRSYWLDDDVRQEIADRAYAWRLEHQPELLGGYLPLSPSESVSGALDALETFDALTTCAAHRLDPDAGKDCAACRAMWNEHTSAAFRNAWGAAS